jgi:cell division protein FtsZ
LKLNEVAEASSIIQEAAHEDANIIFGAVLDESMGEDVKFTVIATGFRDAQPARRERMLAGAGLPTAHLRESAGQFASATPRIAKPPVARFASEPEMEFLKAEPAPVVVPFASHVEAEPEPIVDDAEMPAMESVEEMPEYTGSSYYETARQQARQEMAPRIEFAPVVEQHEEEPEFAFDEPEAESAHEAVSGPVIVEHGLVEDVPAETISEEPVAETAAGRDVEPELVPVRASVFDDDFFRRPREEAASKASEPELKRWPEARVPSFVGYAGNSEPVSMHVPAAAAAEDELDIPAFLRRKS